MSGREIKEKYQTKHNKTDRNILSYYPHQTEKNNYLGETELASGKTLKSCEIILAQSGIFSWLNVSNAQLMFG